MIVPSIFDETLTGRILQLVLVLVLILVLVLVKVFYYLMTNVKAMSANCTIYYETTVLSGHTLGIYIFSGFS